MPPISRAEQDTASYPWLPLLVVLIVALAARMSVALLIPNVHRPDEIFQNLEPAYRILTGTGIVTWEWHVGLRSPLYPGFLAVLMGIARAFGAGPAGYLATVTAVLSLVSVLTVAIGFDAGWRRGRLAGAVIGGMLCATWPDLVYFGPKALTEVQAGNLLIVAAYLGSAQPAPHRHWRWTVIGAGLFLGLAFCLRIQLAPAMLVVALWTCRLEWRRWLLLAAGGIGPLLALGVADELAWHIPFVSVFRNFHLNLVAGISQEFGTEPFHWYASTLLERWGAALVPLGATFLLGARRAPLLAVASATVLLSHSAVAHKEISFIYAAIPPLIVVAGLGTIDLVGWLAAPARAAAVLASAGFWTATSAATALSGGMDTVWRTDTGVLQAEQMARNDPALCGLGVRWPQVTWVHTAGDVYLGRHVPLYGFGSRAGIARVEQAINYAIGGVNVAEGLPSFSVVGCWPNHGGRVCLARSQRTACVADPAFEVGNVPDLGRPWTMSGADRPD